MSAISTWLGSCRSCIRSILRLTLFSAITDGNRLQSALGHSHNCTQHYFRHSYGFFSFSSLRGPTRALIPTCLSGGGPLSATPVSSATNATSIHSFLAPSDYLSCPHWTSPFPLLPLTRRTEETNCGCY